MESAVKILSLQKSPGSILFYKLFLPKLQERILLILQKMFQGGKKGKPPTNFTKFRTNLITKLEYSAIKDNYRPILHNYSYR